MPIPSQHKRGNSFGPSVVVTSDDGDTVVLWGEPANGVVQRQVIWGAGSTHLLEEGIAWADISNTTGKLTLPRTSPAPQHVFLAAKNTDGTSRGMEEVGCKLTPRHALNISLVLVNASSTSLELKVGLGLCSNDEDERLLLQKATITVYTHKTVFSYPTGRSHTVFDYLFHGSSVHYSNSISLTNLQSSEYSCRCYCIDLEVETMLGNASLVRAPTSSRCSFCTGKTQYLIQKKLENNPNIIPQRM